MKNKILAAFIFLCTIANAQVTVDWFNYPGGVGIATDSANNVYTANWDYNPAGDITLTKRNPGGTILWDATYNNTDNTTHEVATWVETDHAGNILVSGIIRSGFSNPVNAASILMKYNSSGTLLWRVVYESSFDGSSTKKCLVDANNNIYVLGIGTGPNGQVTKVKKFNSAGVSVWNYFDTGIGAPITFKFTPDNNIVIVHRGITGSINGYSKIDLNGNNIWSLAGIASLTVGDAAGDAFGNTYIINGANPGSILKKLSPSGTVLWSQTNTQNGTKVEVGNDNNPVVGGNPAVGYGVMFLKYTANGSLLWQNLDADGPSNAFLALTPMKLDASNAAYIAGSTMSLMGMCKVNNDGTSAWVATTSSGYPVWFDFGNDNNVYVTGGTTARFLQTPPILPCLPPTNLSVTNISATSVKLNWTSIPGIIRYNIYYKKTTDVTWTRLNASKLKSSLILNNLTCNSTYKWKIRTVCDTTGANLVSAFSQQFSFSTAACRFADDASEMSNIAEIFPNPASSFATMSFSLSENKNVSIRIVDMTGRSIMEIPTSNLQSGENELIMDVSSLKSGLYYCIIQTNEKQEIVKLVKN